MDAHRNALTLHGREATEPADQTVLSGVKDKGIVGQLSSFYFKWNLVIIHISEV